MNFSTRTLFWHLGMLSHVLGEKMSGNSSLNNDDNSKTMLMLSKENWVYS